MSMSIYLALTGRLSRLLGFTEPTPPVTTEIKEEEKVVEVATTTPIKTQEVLDKYPIGSRWKWIFKHTINPWAPKPTFVISEIIDAKDGWILLRDVIIRKDGTELLCNPEARTIGEFEYFYTERIW